MSIKYITSRHEPTRIEIISNLAREDDSHIYTGHLENQFRRHKSAWETYHDTWEDAAQCLLDAEIKRRDQLAQDLDTARENIEIIMAMVG